MQLYVYNIIMDELILQQNFWNNRKQKAKSKMLA